MTIMTFDLSVLLNTMIGAIVSILTSWYVSDRYYKKKSPAEKIGTEIQSDLRRALLPLLYPQFFDDSKTRKTPPDQGISNIPLDTPYAECATYSSKDFPRGGKVEILLYVQDTGINLTLSSGVKVTNHKDQLIPTMVIGFGFLTFDIFVAHDEKLGQHKFNVALKDDASPPNENAMSFTFNVV